MSAIPKHRRARTPARHAVVTKQGPEKKAPAKPIDKAEAKPAADKRKE